MPARITTRPFSFSASKANGFTDFIEMRSPEVEAVTCQERWQAKQVVGFIFPDDVAPEDTVSWPALDMTTWSRIKVYH